MSTTSPSSGTTAPRVAVIGAGPAGLMAASVLQSQGAQVHVFDSMASVGRKFLLAGIGGLNLTHSESLPGFVSRYAARAATLAPLLDAFGPETVRAWAAGLGVGTFVGTSGRVFPKDLKAAPLLRAWLHRLRAGGEGAPPVQFHMRHRWLGWSDIPTDTPADMPSAATTTTLRFESGGASTTFEGDATVLALGGASWSRLGSDGAWVPLPEARGVDVAPLRPSNCGFDVAPTAPGRDGWSAHLRERFAGEPLKPVAITVIDAQGRPHRLPVDS